jgi:hypothetical protein
VSGTDWDDDLHSGRRVPPLPDEDGIGREAEDLLAPTAKPRRLRYRWEIAEEVEERLKNLEATQPRPKRPDKEMERARADWQEYLAARTPPPPSDEEEDADATRAAAMRRYQEALEAMQRTADVEPDIPPPPPLDDIYGDERR